MYRKLLTFCAVAAVFTIPGLAAAQQITVVDTNLTLEEATGGLSYQNLPAMFPMDLTADMYATGTLHQKVTVSATPGMRETTISFCLVQTDRMPANRACSDPTALSFMMNGEFTANQAVDTFDQAGNLDFTMPLAEVLIIAGDATGNPVDSSNMMWDGSPDFSLYYPLTVRYEAVLVANGATFMGFPSDPMMNPQAETPTIDPPAGSFQDSVRVTLESATMDAEIRYTTDGSDPDENSRRYEGPLTFLEDTQLRARAFAMDMDPSDIASADYTITVPDSGLRGRYYNGRNFGELANIRTDSQLDFMWEGGESPAPGVDSRFSVIWTGTIEPLYSETYTIKTVNDDGVRLWVNNQLLIDDWESHGPLERSGNITLQEGEQYDIWLEYFNGGGAGTLQFIWVSPTQPEEIITDSQTTPFPNDNTAFVSLLVDEDDTEIAETITEPIQLEVKRRGGIDDAVSVQVMLSGTAVNGEDYEMVGGTVEIPAGELSANIEILPTLDGEVEGEEEIVVTLTDGNGYTLSEPVTQTITLLDFDTESFPLAGEVRYTGTESGQIFVEAFTDADEEFEKLQTVLLDPGPFSLSGGEGEYQVVAFIDTNDNERLDNDELWIQNVDENGFPIYYTPPATDIVLNLDEARVGDVPPEINENSSSGDDGGCATAGSGSSGGLVVILLVGLFLRRRRSNDGFLANA